MKKLFVVMVVLVMAGAIAARAENAPAPAKPARPAGGHGGPPRYSESLLSPRMLEELALTDDQKAKYTALDEQWKKEREALQAKQDAAALAKLRDEMKAAHEAKDEAKMKELRAETAKQMAPILELRKQYTDKVMALLTAEQKEKLEKLRKEHRGPPGGPPRGATPPPTIVPKN